MSEFRNVVALAKTVALMLRMDGVVRGPDGWYRDSHGPEILRCEQAIARALGSRVDRILQQREIVAGEPLGPEPIDLRADCEDCGCMPGGAHASGCPSGRALAAVE